MDLVLNTVKELWGGHGLSLDPLIWNMATDGRPIHQGKCVT